MFNSSTLHDGRGCSHVVSRSELGTTGESMFIRPQNDARLFLPLPTFLIPTTDLAFRAFTLGERGSNTYLRLSAAHSIGTTNPKVRHQTPSSCQVMYDGEGSSAVFAHTYTALGLRRTLQAHKKVSISPYLTAGPWC